MASAAAVVLVSRRCRASACGQQPWVCRSCYRGQAYCSAECRAQSRCEQRRRANRRHQCSEAGRLDHRDRQRTYRRRRRAAACVTDQGSAVAADSASIAASVVVVAQRQRPSGPVEVRHGPRGGWSRVRSPLCCVRCGRVGRFMEAFARRE